MSASPDIDVTDIDVTSHWPRRRASSAYGETDDEGKPWFQDEDEASGRGGTGMGSGIGAMGSGIGAMGWGNGHGRMFGAGGASKIDKRAFLNSQLVAAMKTCNASSAEASATLESTLDEIVDVVTVELAPARDAKAEACIGEELWKVDLPAASFADAFEAHVVHAKR